jgi:hypothetical protein
MDHPPERLDALESQVRTLTQHMHTVTRRLRWWRGLAGGLAVLALLSLLLSSAPVQGGEGGGLPALERRVAALERLLKPFSREKHEIFITGANLHLVNGLNSTDCTDEQHQEIPDCPNGLGNLIVGYNEIGEFRENIRTGSHNVVVGSENDFSRFGGIIVGLANTISGDFASVSGAFQNTASGNFAVVSGGIGNTASGVGVAVSGGQQNTASGSDVDFGAAVSGGITNTASGLQSTVSGGQNVTQEAAFGWAAGSEAEAVVVGNFRSP